MNGKDHRLTQWAPDNTALQLLKEEHLSLAVQSFSSSLLEAQGLCLT